MYGGIATPLALLNGEAPPRRLTSRPPVNEPPVRNGPRLPVLKETHRDRDRDRDVSNHRGGRGECEPLLPLSNSVMKILPNSNNGKFTYSNNFNENSYNNGSSVNYNFNNTNSTKPFDTPKSKLGHFDNLNCGNSSSSNNNNNNNSISNNNNGHSYISNGHNKGNGHYNINSNGLMCKNSVLDVDLPPPPLPPHKSSSRNQQQSVSRFVFFF